MHADMRQHVAWVAWVAVGGLIAAAAMSAPSQAAALLIYAVVMCCSALSLALILRHGATRLRDPWWLVAVGLAFVGAHLVLTAGQEARWWWGLQAGAVSSLLQLTGYLLVVTASARFIRIRAGGSDWDGVIDGSIVGCATAEVVWQWSAVPGPSGRWTAVALGALPAVLLAVVFALAVRMLFVASDVPAARLLAASSITSFVGNVLILRPGLDGHLPRAAFGCWIGCQALLLAAAVHPSRPKLVLGRPASESVQLLSRLTMLGLALAAIPVSTALHSVQDRTVPVLGTTMITALALGRIGRLLYDRERRARHQAAMLDLGRVAVSADLGTLCATAVTAAGRALGTDRVAVVDTSDGEVAVRAAGRSWPGDLSAAEQRVLLEAFAARGTAHDGVTEARVRAGRLWLMPFGPSVQPHGFVAATVTGSAGDLATLDGIAQILGSGVRRLDAEALLLHSSLHDALTGLPNRVLLHERLSAVIRRCRGSAAALAVMFVDLDGFKQVNDTFGHAAGDDILVEVGARLTASVRPGDTVARVSGDEFVVLIEDVAEAITEAAAARVVAALAEPIPVGTGVATLSASVGALLARPAPGDGMDSDSVLCEADELMYRVKNSGRNNFALAAAGAPPSVDGRGSPAF